MRDRVARSAGAVHAHERGRELAAAFDEDLERRGVDRSFLRRWALLIRRNEKEYRSPTKRAAALERIAAAIPVTARGDFDERFSATHAALDRLLRPAVDPLVGEAGRPGPLGATVEAVLAHPDLGSDSLGRGVAAGVWGERLRRAHRPLVELLAGSKDVPPLFVTLGHAFVEGMSKAFPAGSVDCVDVGAATRRVVDGGLQADYRRGRDAYRAARDELRSYEEEQPDLQRCPAIELGRTAGVRHFDRWLADHERLSIQALVELHTGQPRFVEGRVMPLVDVDGASAYLEREFPWTEVERPEAPDLDGGSADVDEDDDEEGDDYAEDDDQELGRMLQTQYWYTAEAAARLIVGGGA